jgi:UDP-4-amino-4-deoxy-L-arabinose-oxoglutarate aminotransferase
MDNIQAALLLGQLVRIDELWHQRDVRWKTYEDALAGIKDISWMKTLEGVRHARHLFTILVPPRKRDQLLWALQNRGIGVAVNYRPIHLLKYYRACLRYREGDFPVAEEIGSRTISLPFYPYLSDEALAYVVQVLKEELNR